jgi:CRP/FNR family transcriptional regulator, cyclic AMP receptor protein
MQLSNSSAFNAQVPINCLTQCDGPFSRLTGEAQRRFDAMGTEKTFSHGEYVFLEGQMPEFVYILCSGRVKLSVTSRDGKNMILRIAESGDVLGLSAALNSSEYEVSAEIVDFCRVKTIRTHDFVEFLNKYPAAAMEATQCLLQEHRHMFKDVCRLGLPATVAGRLANLLLDWRESRVKAGHAEPRLTLTLTQEEIAGMTGTSRETVSRVLQQFQREELISIKGAFLTVLQPKALEQLAV